MARFYGEIQGSRGPASRMGTPKSGFSAHVRGWNIGVHINCFVNDLGNDVIEVWRTGGSNDSRRIHRLVELEHAS